MTHTLPSTLVLWAGGRRVLPSCWPCLTCSQKLPGHSDMSQTYPFSEHLPWSLPDVGEAVQGPSSCVQGLGHPCFQSRTEVAPEKS